MEAYFIPKRRYGASVMDEQEEDIGSMSSFSEDEEGSRSISIGSTSSSSEITDDATSPNSSSSNTNDHDDDESFDESPLFEMASLITQLPFKRGLSKFFDGKSQSFASLANVQSLEDLVKPEKALQKRRLKSSKSYGGCLDAHKCLSPKNCSRVIAKKSSSSKGSPLSVLAAHRRRNGSFLSGIKPPISPVSSSLSLPQQNVGLAKTLLLA